MKLENSFLIRKFPNLANIITFYKLYIFKYRKYLVLVFITMIIVSISTSFLGYITKPVINDVFIRKDVKMLYLISLSYVVCSLIKALASYFQNILIYLIQEKVINDVRLDIFKKILKLKIESIDKITKGKILTLFNADLSMISENFAIVFLTTFRDLATMGFLLSIVFYQNTALALFATVMFPLALFPLRNISKSIRKKYQDSQKKQDIMTNTINETLSGIKTIKAYCSECFEIRRFDLILKHLFKVSFGFKRRGSFGSPFMEFVGGLSTTLVILYGGFLVINEKSDAGTFFSFLISIILAYKPARGLSGIGLKMNAVNISTGRILDLLLIESSYTEEYNSTKYKQINLKQKEIEFKNVSFTYKEKNSQDAQNDDMILKNISFKIKEGEKVAFVGTSGSGKSTIVDLLMGFYEIKEGEILIGGLNIENINIQEIRKNIGYVTQDSFLFDGDINRNIIYNTKSQEPYDISKIKEISVIDFEEETQKQTNLIENTDNENKIIKLKLSIGQKQRIGIARAIYKNPEILILDESTSALDAISEKKIIDNVFDNMPKKTVIIIAHRLHILPRCDKIYVLDKGEIIEEGTHEDLLKKDTKYSKMWFTMQQVI